VTESFHPLDGSLIGYLALEWWLMMRGRRGVWRSKLGLLFASLMLSPVANLPSSGSPELAVYSYVQRQAFARWPHWQKIPVPVVPWRISVPRALSSPTLGKVLVLRQPHGPLCTVRKQASGTLRVVELGMWSQGVHLHVAAGFFLPGAHGPTKVVGVCLLVPARQWDLGACFCRGASFLVLSIAGKMLLLKKKFCGGGIWTQGLPLAKQTLYH
jgi:hypothetical protein